tara:strand:- start:377 stop:877 length:501 start_codon:yes stop_codon:yes gene_type:complete
MKITIKTTFDFGKLASRTPNLISGFIDKTAIGESKQMKKRISSGNTITGKMDALKASTLETRELRRISGSTPLKATGALLNSIKPIKNSVVAKEYGYWHNYAVTTKNRPFIPDSPIYSGKGKGSKSFNFTGKTIPPRRWVHDDSTFKNEKKIIEKFFKDFRNTLHK